MSVTSAWAGLKVVSGPMSAAARRHSAAMSRAARTGSTSPIITFIANQSFFFYVSFTSSVSYCWAWSANSEIALAVNEDVAAKSAAELIALANKTKDGMLFSAADRGGQARLTGELFRDRSKANISFVTRRAPAATLNDAIAGRVPIVFEGLAGLQPGIQGGGVRLLGVAAEAPAQSA